MIYSALNGRSSSCSWISRIQRASQPNDWCEELFDFLKRESRGCSDYYDGFLAKCKNACVPRLGRTASASVARDFQQLFISRDVLLVIGRGGVKMGNADQSADSLAVPCIPISPYCASSSFSSSVYKGSTRRMRGRFLIDRSVLGRLAWLYT